VDLGSALKDDLVRDRVQEYWISISFLMGPFRFKPFASILTAASKSGAESGYRRSSTDLTIVHRNPMTLDSENQFQ